MQKIFYNNLILPKLSKILGIKESIFLQKLHYYCNPYYNNNIFDNKCWFKHTYDQWQTSLPFFCKKTIIKLIDKLKQKGMICVQKLSKKSSDHTNFYTINYQVLSSITKQSNVRINIPNIGINTHQYNKLLVNDQPLLFNTKVATKYSVTKSIILQKLHYWLVCTEKYYEKNPEISDIKKEDRFYDDKFWIYKSYNSWYQDLPFISASTFRNNLNTLLREKIILKRHNNNDGSFRK